MVFSGNPKNLLVNLCLINDSVVCKSLYFSLGGLLLYKRDHPYLRQQKVWAGRSSKWPVLLTFSIELMLT